MEFFACIGVIAILWAIGSPFITFALWGRLRELEAKVRELSGQTALGREKSSSQKLAARIDSETDDAPIEIVERQSGSLPDTPIAHVTPINAVTEDSSRPDSANAPSSRKSTPPEPLPIMNAATTTTEQLLDRRRVSTRPSDDPDSGLQSVPETAAVETSLSPSSAPAAAVTKISVEEVLGGKWLAYVGALAVMIGAGFGLKYAIDNQWLGPEGRVILGVLTGLMAFAGGAFAMRREYRFLGQALTGAALGVLYLSFYAAFDWYQVLSYEWAFAGMVLTTAGGLAFAHAFDSQPTAVLGMIGGFLTPAMLPPSTGSMWLLFPYLMLLDVGVLGVSSVRRWTGLQVLVFFGTAFTWFVWYQNFYTQEVLLPTLGFLTAFFVLFATLSVIHNIVQKRIAEAADFFLMLVTPCVYFAALYWLTYEIWPYEQGYFALAMTAVYTLFAIFAARLNPAGKSATAALAGLAATFLILAPPLSLTGHWVTVAWIAQSILLVELGLRFELTSLSWTGLSLLAKVQCILIIYGIGTLVDPVDFQTAFVRQKLHLTVPHEALALAWTDIFNNRSYSYLVDVFGLGLLAWEYRRRIKANVADDLYGPKQSDLELVLASGVPLVGLLLGLLELFVWGTLRHWHGTTILSACSIWTSLVAGLVVAWSVRVGPRRLEQVSWMLFSALALILGVNMAWTIDEATWQSQGLKTLETPFWLLNSRGIGFFASMIALTTTAVIYRFNPSGQADREGLDSKPNLPPFTLDRLFGSLAYWLGLIMVLLESFVWGMSHQWTRATMLSASTGWTAMFALGLVVWHTNPARFFVRTRPLPEKSSETGMATAVPESSAEPAAMLTAIFVLLGAFLAFTSAVTVNSVNTNEISVLSADNAPLWLLNPRGMSFLLSCIVTAISARLIQLRDRSNDNAISLWLGSASYLAGLTAVLLETLEWGTMHEWQPGTILGASAMWTAAFAAGLIGWRVRWGSRSLDQLVEFVFVLLGAFLLFNSTGTFAHAAMLRKTGATPIDEWWLINPRGMGFGMAVGVSTLAAMLYRSLAASYVEPDHKSKFSLEAERLGIRFGIAAFLAGLILVLLETTIWGMPRGWAFGTLVSTSAMWTALFASAIAIWAAQSSHRELDRLVTGVFLILGGFIVLAGVIPFMKEMDGRALGLNVTHNEWWLINPRGIGFLLTVAASATAATFYQALIPVNVETDGKTSTPSEAENLVTMFGIAAFLVGLILVLLETTIWGMPRGWAFGTLVSTSAMWTALFASGLAIWVASVNNRDLDRLVIGVFILLGGMIVVAGIVPFAEGLNGRSTIDDIVESEWWFMNPRGLGHLLGIGAMGLAAAMYRRIELATPSKLVAEGPTLSQTLGISAYLSGFALVTTEAFTQGTIRQWLTGTSLAVTIAWTLYATGTLVAGIYWRAATVRVLALLLLVLTIGKVFLFDIWHLETVIRVFAFLSLGVALMLVSFLYRRFRERIRNWVLPPIPVLTHSE